MAEVDPDAALVAVDREVVGRGPRAVGVAADPRRPPTARRVALGRLELDHVGAEVAQEHRAVRPGEDRRAVDDAQAGEGTRGDLWHAADGTTAALARAASRRGSI